MRSPNVILPLIAGVAFALPELSISKRDSSLRTSHVARGLVKRDGTVTTNVYDVLTWSAGGAYYANVTVGTPPQDQVVILDTGSSDLYFDASSSNACETTGPYSCRGGTFNTKSSTTYKVVADSPAFNTSFGDGSTAIGPFARDVIGIGDVKISGVQFGVGQDVNSTTGYAIGLMGIGYSIIEASHTIYPNMPEVLLGAGQIASRLYSVFLNSVGETSGSILFGGIDTSKYTGDLVTTNILPDPTAEFVIQFLSTVTGLSASVGGRQSTVFSGGSPDTSVFSDNPTALAVLLDTGSSAWTVPYELYVRDIEPLFNYVDREGLCSCKHRTTTDTLTVEFAAAINITVPATEFIVPLYNSTTNEVVQYSDGSPACVFMISPDVEQQQAQSGFLTLGDAILRSMYVVFDLDNAQLSIAQAAVNSTAKPNIVTIGAGPSAIASALRSSYSPAPSNTATIAGPVSAGATYSVSTLASTIGLATGTAAIPADARPGSGTESSPEGSNGGATGHGTTSSGAATGVVIPGADWSGVWVSGIAVCMAAIGAAVMM